VPTAMVEGTPSTPSRMDIRAWVPEMDIWLKIIGLIVGAVWAFFLLFYLRQRASVDTEIRKKESEIEIARKKLEIELAADQINTQKKEFEIKELELKTRKQIGVTIDIHADVSADNKGYTLIATVAITNHGNEATRIRWKDEPPPFAIHPVNFDVEGKAQPGDQPLSFSVMQTRNLNQPAVSHIIRAGATETLTFAARLRAPGLYLLSFRGATAKDVRVDAVKYGVLLPAAYTANRYVYVGEPPASANSST